MCLIECIIFISYCPIFIVQNVNLEFVVHFSKDQVHDHDRRTKKFRNRKGGHKRRRTPWLKKEEMKRKKKKHGRYRNESLGKNRAGE